MAILTELDVTSVLSTLTLSLLFYFVYKNIRERNYPPGPTGIPFFGYALFLGKDTPKALQDLAKNYGDIFSFTLFSKLHICISDFYMMKEMLSNPLLLTRPPKMFNFVMGKGGMVGTNGEEWREQRRFAFMVMRNLGLGKGLWEQMIQYSLEDLIADIKSYRGKPMLFENLLTTSQANTSISLLIGRRLDPKTEKESLDCVKIATRALESYLSSTAVATVSHPWLTKFLVFFRLGGYHTFFPILRRFEDIFRTEVEKRLKMPESLEKEDFIGIYFQEMKKMEEEGKPSYFSIENLLGNMLMLFIGGNDTTMASVTWLLLLMAAYPEIQKKVHDEIDATVGKDGAIYFEIKTKLIYTAATIFEMWRYIAIAPLYPPRYTFQDIEFRGYTIPKGTHIITNIWSIMRDPRYFKDPESFRPERFITEDNKLVKLDGWAPFSFGKRNCPGEGTANVNVFLYFAHIMQKFKIAAPPGKKVDLEANHGAETLPKPQELCFIER